MAPLLQGHFTKNWHFCPLCNNLAKKLMLSHLTKTSILILKGSRDVSDKKAVNKFLVAIANRPYSIRMISAHESIQCPVFTMVILTLDAILSSRTSVATSSSWFGTAYGRYSRRKMMLLWYCKWRTTPS